MKAFLLGCILLSSMAEAQVLDRIFNRSKSTSGLVAKWSCPQDSYKSVAQLRTDADVSISYDQNGNIKLNPDVFKVKTLSGEFLQGAVGSVISKERLVVDYSNCLEKFKQNIQAAVTNHKSNQCDPSDKICQINSEDLLKDVDSKINQSSFFQKTQGSKKIPTFLPGSSALRTDVNYEERAQAYCEGKDVDPADVLNKGIIQSLSYKTGDINSPLGLVCLKKIKALLISEKNKLDQEFCAGPEKSQICSQLSNNTESFIQGLDGLIETKTSKVLAAEERNYKFQYGSDANEALGEKYFSEKLSQDSIKCDDFRTSFREDNKFVRINQLDKTINKNVGNLFSKLDKSCADIFLQNYINDKQNFLSGSSAFNKFCELHKTEYCESQENKRSLILSNIDQMFKAVYGNLGDRLVSDALQCNLVESTDPLKDILSKIADAGKAVKCIDLKNGEHKVVSSYDGQGIVRTGHYTLKKTGDNKFQATLNMNFYNEAAQKTTPEEMMDRVKKCMADVSPYLKGPNGEQLEVLPLTQDEINRLPSNERPLPHRIGIEKPGFRSHSMMYMETLDCPTITHEVLHLFGLCDEYKETGYGAGSNYECRTVVKSASIMKSQGEAFNKGVGKTTTCDCSQGLCSTVMKSEDEDLKSFYLAKSIYDMTDYQYRNKYCTYKYLKDTNYSKLPSPGKRGIVLASATNSVSIEVRQFTDEYPVVSRTTLSCTCEEGDTECTDGLSSISNYADSTDNTRWCPAGTRNKDFKFGGKPKGEGIQYADGELVIENKPEWPSLLHPNHFERIIGGGCGEKGASYSECAQNAYRNKDCASAEKCKDDKYFLGIKQ